MTCWICQYSQGCILVVTTYVHAGELTPDLGENPNMSSIDHMRLEKLEIRDISVATFELARVFDLLQLLEDESIVPVAFGVDSCQYTMAVLPAIFAC